MSLQLMWAKKFSRLNSIWFWYLSQPFLTMSTSSANIEHPKTLQSSKQIIITFRIPTLPVVAGWSNDVQNYVQFQFSACGLYFTGTCIQSIHAVHIHHSCQPFEVSMREISLIATFLWGRFRVTTFFHSKMNTTKSQIIY